MKHFLKKLCFFLIFPLFIGLAGLLLPATPKASKYLTFSSLQKDSLMQNTASPRIIFVGGSNLSFSLNSQMIKDSLHINPVNTGIHACIGLIFMLDNALEYVKENDIVILVPDYQEFYGDYAYGGEGQELIRTIFDVNIHYIKLLGFRQMIQIAGVMPQYLLSKFNPYEYISVVESDIYGVHSFNQYGDACAHWGMEKVDFTPYEVIAEKFDSSVMDKIKSFEKQIGRKNAKLFVSYSGLQGTSYNNIVEQIKHVEKEFARNGFRIIGTPERYIMPDSMMFNNPSHLNKTGVDFRTRLFIEDFKKSPSDLKSSGLL